MKNKIKVLKTTGKSFKEADDKMDDQVSRYIEEIEKSRTCYMENGVHVVKSSVLKYK